MSYVASVRASEGIIIYQDSHSNTRFTTLSGATPAPGRIDQLDRLSSLRTVPIIGMFPDIASRLADLYYRL